MQAQPENICTYARNDMPHAISTLLNRKNIKFIHRFLEIHYVSLESEKRHSINGIHNLKSVIRNFVIRNS